MTKNNDDKQFVSVIVPCYNEQQFIVAFLENLGNQDYPVELIEYLIIDGMSTDNTRDLLKKNIVKYSNVTMYDNQNKTQPYALNLGIQKSKGDIIIRMDVHCSYPDNYISELIRNLLKFDTDNVGGIWKNESASTSKRAIAISLATSCGFCVGNAQYRITNNKEPYYVDTVPFGCFHKSLFSRIGLFDVSLPRGEDDEFNARIIKNGGKILLIPSIQIGYYTRDDFSKLFKMFYQYGLYKPLTNKKIGKITSIRQLIPLLFVCYIFCFPILNIVFSTYIFILPLFLYFAISFIMAIKIKCSMFFLIMYAFLISHVSYGIGYAVGIINFVIRGKDSEQIEITR